MQQPLISILVPFKNTEAYIGECLDSITAQTYNNWELVIVNDNSEDSSYTIVKGYANNDKRVKLLNSPGNGIIEALRYAYSNSKGEFITRMDSDDIMTPKKLEILIKSLLEFGKGHVALGQVHYFSEKGIGAGYKYYEEWLNSLTKSGTNFSEIYKECVIPSPCWMLHRNDLDLIEAFKPDRYPEDYDLAFRCYSKGIKCIPCNSVLHHWRDYDHRTSRTHEHYAQNHFIDIKLHYFLKLNFDSTRPLAIWGAGNKGKTIAKLLIEKKIPFFWICDNPNKIGKDIYGKYLLDFNYLEQLDNPQSIITVANSQAQLEIKRYMQSHNMKSMHDYFFFC